MSQSTNRLQLPDKLRSKLETYQRTVWWVKLLEGIGAALFGLLVSYLVVFTLDRFIETSGWWRGGILLVGSLGLAIWFPLVCHKWIWKSRRLEQVARFLKIQHPRLGDYLLGIIELVNSEDRGNTSEALCQAALQQADERTADRDFSNDVPNPRHKTWLGMAAVPLMLGVAALIIVPAAGSNALARWLMPWRKIDRYTFANIDQLPTEWVVPLSEPSVFPARLSESSRWKPENGVAWVGRHRMDAESTEGEFQFSLPPIKNETDLKLRIGDDVENVKLNPQPRPELKTLSATIHLPEYLQRSEPVEQELRGGGLAVIDGGQFQLNAEATRELVYASLNDQRVKTEGAQFQGPTMSVQGESILELSWKDGMGLSAKVPLRLKVRSAKDEAPELVCRDLERRRVILAKDVLSFQLDINDDWGIRQVGMEWVGNPVASSASQPAKGEKIIAAGDPSATRMDAITATFCPQRENIEPQPITLKLFAEDYLPGRPRVYSLPYKVFILSEDEHAVWMTERLDKWFKQALENYEVEQQLFEKNKQLRSLSPEELDRPDIRRQIEKQARSERRQSEKLSSLNQAGEELIKEAARNDQFGVAHLEKLAEMIQRLKDVEENRMPSVADLLKQAANAAASSSSQPSKQADKDQKPQPNSDSDSGEPKESQSSGSVSDNQELERPGSDNDEPEEDSKDEDSDSKKQKGSEVPSIDIRESSMESEDKKSGESGGKSSSGGKLTIPSVTLSKLPSEGQGGACPAGQKMNEAVEAQEDLLAEFQDIAEELQKLIGDLEGSTFVKRLKALSRRELLVARDVGKSTLSGFGASSADLREATVKRMKMLSDRQQAHLANLKTIQEDMVAYANRVQQAKFKTVLAEMEEMDIVSQTASVADKIVTNVPGTSIAHSEFLADTFDRWAEQLVGPG